MKKLFQQLGLDAAIPGMFGIEIEAEGQGMKKVANKYWQTEDDGSLRGEYPTGRAEFVLKTPVVAEEVLPALDNLVKALQGAEFDFSYRTSVHVHVNVQDLTTSQLLNFVYTYLLLEEPMMTYCGKARKGNRFCLRLRDAEGMLGVLDHMFTSGDGGFRVANDDVRYSAINLAALNKYGSVEFRGMRGNMDVNVIHTWTKALHKLRTFGAAQESPKTILALIEKLGALKFMEHVLGDLFETFAYPRVAKDIASSFSLSLDLPYAYQIPEAAPELPILYKKGVPARGVRGQIIYHGGIWYNYTNTWEEEHNWKTNPQIVKFLDDMKKKAAAAQEVAVERLQAFNAGLPVAPIRMRAAARPPEPVHEEDDE